MADSFGTPGANTALNALAGAFTWVQLHTGAPGAAGTSNVATNSTRKQATFGTSTSNSLITTADLLWSSVSTTEAYTHATVWSASTSGNFGGSGAVSSGSVTAGNDFKIAAGSLVASVTLAS